MKKEPRNGQIKNASSNGVEDNITKIAQLFPDCVTRRLWMKAVGQKHLIDFEKLKTESF